MKRLKSAIFKGSNEAKKEIKESPIQQELRVAREQLTQIWQRVLPDQTTQPYSLDNGAPFQLTRKQLKNFIVSLSVITTLVDEMIAGFTVPRPATYPNEWKAPHERYELSYIRCSFSKGEKISHHDVPVHFENHFIIMGMKSREQKEEDIIEIIAEGEPRARSLLEKLVKPFISSFNNVVGLPKCMQKLCDALAPSNKHACCIDARTRQAFDYALSDDVTLPTFSELLFDARNHCPDDAEDSYFYLLANLIKYHWGKKYKADTGKNGICKKSGTLTLESYNLIHSGLIQIFGKNYSNDFLYSYEIVPNELQSEYLKLMVKQTDFFKSFKILSTEEVERYSKILSARIAGKSFLCFILTECDSDIATEFVYNSHISQLINIEDIWTEINLFKCLTLKYLRYIQLCSFLKNVKPEFLENIIQLPDNNPFEHILAKQEEKFFEILHIIKNKLKSQDIAKLFLDAKINHFEILRHPITYSLLHDIIPPSLLLDIYISKNILSMAFDPAIQPFDKIAELVELILEAALEKIGSSEYEYQNVLSHLTHKQISYNDIKTNFLGYFILKNNDKDEDYSKIFEKIPSSALLNVFKNMGIDDFTISLKLLVKILMGVPQNNISDIFKSNFKISINIPKEQCVDILLQIVPILSKEQTAVLFKQIPSDKIQEIFNDNALYSNFLKSIEDHAIKQIVVEIFQAMDAFTALLYDAVRQCHKKKKTSYFYLLANLMKNNWEKEYKNDADTDELLTKIGVLTTACHDQILKRFRQIVGKINFTNDFLYAYKIVPMHLREEYLKLIIKQENFFSSLSINSANEYDCLSKLIKEKISGKSFLYYILSTCDQKITNKFIGNSLPSSLNEIDDIWSNIAIYQYSNFKDMPASLLFLFLNKISPDFLESLIKLPHNNPFSNYWAKFQDNFIKILDCIGNKLKPQDLKNLILSATFDHKNLLLYYNFYGDNRVKIKLSKLLTASMLLEIYISKNLLEMSFNLKNRLDQDISISQMVNLIIQAGLENKHTPEQEKILAHLVKRYVIYNGIETNFLGYYILKNERYDEYVYSKFLEKIPSSTLMEVFNNTGLVNFDISISLLEKIIAHVPRENIFEIFNINFKISDATSKEQLAETLSKILAFLSVDQVQILFYRISPIKIQELYADTNLFTQLIESIKDPTVKLSVRAFTSIIASPTAGEDKRHNEEISFHQNPEKHDSINIIKNTFNYRFNRALDKKFPPTVISEMIVIKIESLFPSMWHTDLDKIFEKLQLNNVIINNNSIIRIIEKGDQLDTLTIKIPLSNINADLTLNKKNMKKIQLAAEKFDAWMKRYEYRDYHREKGHLDNHNKALIGFLTGVYGFEYVKNYEDLCHLSNLIKLKGYQATNPPCHRIEFALALDKVMKEFDLIKFDGLLPTMPSEIKPIHIAAEKFDAWMRKNQDIHRRDGHLENPNNALVNFLNSDCGFDYIKTFEDLCFVSELIKLKGYETTNPPCPISDFAKEVTLAKTRPAKIHGSMPVMPAIIKRLCEPEEKLNSTEELVNSLKQIFQYCLRPNTTDFMLFRRPNGYESLASENLKILETLEEQYKAQIPRDEFLHRLNFPPAGSRLTQIMVECFGRFPDAGKIKLSDKRMKNIKMYPYQMP